MTDIKRQKIINTISMSKRAGKLILGFDTVKESVVFAKTDCVFIADDLSEKTKKEVLYFCDEYSAKAINMPITMQEILFAVNKKSGIIAVSDEGLCKKLYNLCSK